MVADDELVIELSISLRCPATRHLYPFLYTPPLAFRTMM